MRSNNVADNSLVLRLDSELYHSPNPEGAHKDNHWTTQVALSAYEKSVALLKEPQVDASLIALAAVGLVVLAKGKGAEAAAEKLGAAGEKAMARVTEALVNKSVPMGLKETAGLEGSQLRAADLLSKDASSAQSMHGTGSRPSDWLIEPESTPPFADSRHDRFFGPKDYITPRPQEPYVPLPYIEPPRYEIFNRYPYYEPSWKAPGARAMARLTEALRDKSVPMDLNGTKTLDGYHQFRLAEWQSQNASFGLHLPRWLSDIETKYRMAEMRREWLMREYDG
jgi:hypothetical protein